MESLGYFEEGLPFTIGASGVLLSSDLYCLKIKIWVYRFSKRFGDWAATEFVFKVFLARVLIDALEITLCKGYPN